MLIKKIIPLVILLTAISCQNRIPKKKDLCGIYLGNQKYGVDSLILDSANVFNRLDENNPFEHIVILKNGDRMIELGTWKISNDEIQFKNFSHKLPLGENIGMNTFCDIEFNSEENIKILLSEGFYYRKIPAHLK